MTKSTVKQFEAWHKTRPGLATFGLLELVATYFMGSRAIYTGSWWEYAVAVLLFIGGLKNLYRFIRKK